MFLFGVIWAWFAHRPVIIAQGSHVDIDKTIGSFFETTVHYSQDVEKMTQMRQMMINNCYFYTQDDKQPYCFESIQRYDKQLLRDR